MTIACPDCGTLEDLLPLPRRSTAVCVRCDTALERTNGRSVTAALACSLATLLLLLPANLMPLIRVDLFGLHSQNVTAQGVAMLWSRGWVLLAAATAVTVIVLPPIRFGLLAAVLAAVRLGHRPRWLGPAFRWALWLDPWAMLDVYLLAAFVGYFRLDHVSQAQVSILTGGMCFVAAAVLTMLSRATLDQRTVWRAIGPEVQIGADQPTLACLACDLVQPAACAGQRCPRCGSRLHARVPGAVRNTTALLIAAFLLFFPANILPMNVSRQLGSIHAYTIFTGIKDLFVNGLWPLGALVFCTSILVPAGKIFAVGWCVISAQRGWTRHLVLKTRLFHLVAELGRWSKTDPLTIVFFVPLMDFHALASADAGWGATAFLLTSFLTMVSSNTFDPRLMWDAAQTEAGADG